MTKTQVPTYDRVSCYHGYSLCWAMVRQNWTYRTVVILKLQLQLTLSWTWQELGKLTGSFSLGCTKTLFLAYTCDVSGSTLMQARPTSRKQSPEISHMQDLTQNQLSLICDRSPSTWVLELVSLVFSFNRNIAPITIWIANKQENEVIACKIRNIRWKSCIIM